MNHPYIRDHPGQLSGGWLEVEGRTRSKAIQEKLGFKPLARKRDMWKGLNAAAAMWCGEFDVKKEDTMFKDLEDY